MTVQNVLLAGRVAQRPKDIAVLSLADERHVTQEPTPFSLRFVNATSRARDELIRDEFGGDYGAYLDDTLGLIRRVHGLAVRRYVDGRLAELRRAA